MIGRLALLALAAPLSALTHLTRRPSLRASRSLLSMSAGYPLSVRNVVSRMTESTQRALQQRTTRMEVRRMQGIPTHPLVRPSLTDAGGASSGL